MASYSTDTIFSASVPMKALSFSTRNSLSRYLNPEQSLPYKRTKLLRDYRGLACQIGFEPIDIRNFKTSKNPTMDILDEWTQNPNATIQKLIQFLESMGRFDIIQDLNNFEEDIKEHLKREQSYLQVDNISIRTNEATSELERTYVNNNDISGERFYDAYISFADEDIEFVKILYDKLSQEGFDLYFRMKDSLAGDLDYVQTLDIIERRCHYVLVILSPDFLKCPACEVQASFAAELGYEKRRRKIIPILIQPCEMPLILSLLTRIDFTKPDPNNWCWGRLISSLRDNRKRPQANFSLPRIEGSSNVAITFPPSTVQSINANETIDELFCENSKELENNYSFISSTSKELKSKFRNMYNKMKKKSVVDMSVSSNATSGFHSQSTS